MLKASHTPISQFTIAGTLDTFFVMITSRLIGSIGHAHLDFLYGWRTLNAMW